MNKNEDFNICTASDSYKMAHWNMYPDNTETNFAYFESREGAEFDETVFFGLQWLIKKFFIGKVVTKEGINRAERRINAHFGFNAFNREGWEYILNNYQGKLPLIIKAIPEGKNIPTGNILMSVENTDNKCAWLANYVETVLTHVWSSSTVATLSYNVKLMMKEFLDRTSNNPDALDFMLHCFGFRGVSSFMSASIQGAGHLVNFKGTDTFPAVETTMDYYNSNEVTAFSVPATEHSIMTARGRNGEMDIVGNLLKKYPTGILSLVIDSYDYKQFITNTYKRFGKEILARDGKIVFRPDSGQPNAVTLEVYNLLEKYFGSTKNSKEYKVLNPKVGILWGDGIDIVGIRSILYTLESHSISAENMVFGMGGGLLQKINRDTQRFAFKSSYQVRDGVGYDIFKCPLDISKKSKKGKLILTKDKDDNYITVKETPENKKDNLLETVFLDGKLIRDMTFEEVRTNANN